MNDSSLELSVSDFVAVLNQTLEYAYGSVVIYGELANFRVNKNRWVYFDLKDEQAKLAFFGSVYNLPGPLEDGMMLKVRGVPRLHPQYGFSVLVNNISPSGVGSIKRLNDLLAIKLEKEGLFAAERKRPLPYPPKKIGLITSMQSAAFSDFMKILNDRWVGVEILCADVGVQGEGAPAEIVQAIEHLSVLAEPPEVLVLIRGGGSPEDLAAFSNEQVTRAVAASRLPTLVAIGHEVDVSLAELAADRRASTPSNAAELIVPDRALALSQLAKIPLQLQFMVDRRLKQALDGLEQELALMNGCVEEKIKGHQMKIADYTRLLAALSPKDILMRGYAIVRAAGVASDGTDLASGSIVSIEMAKVNFTAGIKQIRKVTL